MTTDPRDPHDSPPAGSGAAAPAAVPGAGERALPMPRRREPIASEALFGGATEVQIEHRGTLYRLKQTALGKLILTK